MCNNEIKGKEMVERKLLPMYNNLETKESRTGEMG